MGIYQTALQGNVFKMARTGRYRFIMENNICKMLNENAGFTNGRSENQ